MSLKSNQFKPKEAKESIDLGMTPSPLSEEHVGRHVEQVQLACRGPETPNQNLSPILIKLESKEAREGADLEMLLSLVCKGRVGRAWEARSGTQPNAAQNFHVL